MDQMTILKIQNTINETQNLLSKENFDESNFKVLMMRAINQLNLLLGHIGYLESKYTKTDFLPDVSTFTIDSDWNLNLSHGEEANYLVHGQAIKTLVDHIKYLHILIENCPGNKNES